jgi:hypothetical protein
MDKGRPKSGRRNHQPTSEPSENLLIALIAQEPPERAHDSYPHGNNGDNMRDRIAQSNETSIGPFDPSLIQVADLDATIANGIAGGPADWLAGDGAIASDRAASWGAFHKNRRRGATRSV